MNDREESLFVPDNRAIREDTKYGYKKGWDNRKFQDLSIIEGVLRECNGIVEFSQLLKEKLAELDKKITLWPYSSLKV